MSLLRTLESDIAREQLVGATLPELTSLSAKVTLIDRIGHRPNLGHHLVAEIAALHFEENLYNEIQNTQPDALAEERNPILVMSFARERALDNNQQFAIPDSPRITFALLQDCQTGIYRGSLDGSSSGKHSKGISLRNLVPLYGSEELLYQRVMHLMSSVESIRPWINERVGSIEEAEKLLQRATDQLNEHNQG